ncbi:MAG TPA: serine kinase [Clostridiales bacterium]|nr:serine kinase [Clostridiales bacterium]
MKSFTIQLKSINEVKDFVNTVNRFDCDIDLISGRYVVDAKSIMGIFSLDLSKPIRMEIHADNCSETEEALSKSISRFLV